MPRQPVVRTYKNERLLCFVWKVDLLMETKNFRSVWNWNPPFLSKKINRETVSTWRMTAVHWVEMKKKGMFFLFYSIARIFSEKNFILLEKNTKEGESPVESFFFMKARTMAFFKKKQEFKKREKAIQNRRALSFLMCERKNLAFSWLFCGKFRQKKFKKTFLKKVFHCFFYFFCFLFFCYAKKP